MNNEHMVLLYLKPSFCKCSKFRSVRIIPNTKIGVPIHFPGFITSKKCTRNVWWGGGDEGNGM
jgi:hypothetical protein